MIFFLADQQGDTLIHAPFLKANLKDFSLDNKFAVLDYIITENTRVKIQKYKGANFYQYSIFS